MGSLRIASFDIGKKNFCMYVEEVNVQSLNNLCEKTQLPKVPTESQHALVHKLMHEGKRLLWQNVNLVQNATERMSKNLVGKACKKDLGPTNELLFRELWYTLHALNSLWETVDLFIIEHQVVFNRAEIQLLAQTCHTYFVTRFENTRPVLYWKNSLKTKLLLCPKEIDGKKVDIKKWTPNLAMVAMHSRQDKEAIQILDKASKKDDLGDSFCQLQSFKYWLMQKWSLQNGVKMLAQKVANHKKKNV